MKLFLLTLFFFIINTLSSQTTVIINCNGNTGSFNSGSVSATGLKNDGEIIGLNNSGGNRGWVRFDLSTIPTGVNITSASVRFITYNSTSSASNNDIYGFTGNPATLGGTTLYASCVSDTSFNNTSWIANGTNVLSLNTSGLYFLKTNIGTSINLSFVRSSANNYTIYGYNNVEALQPQVTITYLLPACTGTPIGGTTNTTKDSVCDNLTSFILSVNGSTGGNISGLTYQWQSSADSLNWNNISGETGLQLTTTQSSTLFYRRRISCGANFSYSIKKLVKTNPIPNGGITQTTKDRICEPTTPFTLSTTGSTSGNISGLQYQWQKSADSLIWSNINGATDTTLITTQSVTTFYRRRTACGTSYGYSTTKRIFSNSLLNGGTIKGARYFCTNGQSIKLYVTGVDFTNGITYQWQQSSDGTNFTDIIGAVQDTLNTTISAETHYRRKTVCGGTVSYSNVRNIKGQGVLNPSYFEFIGEGISCLTQQPPNSWNITEQQASTSGRTTTLKYLFLPPIRLLAQRTYRIRYFRYVYGYDDSHSSLSLKVGTLPNSASITSTLKVENFGEYSNQGYTEVYFTPTTTDNYYFSWSYFDNASSLTYIQDVSVKLFGSCPYPINVSTTNLTSTSVKFNWQIDSIPGSSTVQSYKWDISKTSPFRIIDSGVTFSKTVTYSNLQADSTYIFRVMSVCDTSALPQFSSNNGISFRARSINDTCVGAIRLTQTAYNETCVSSLITTANSSPSPNPPLKNSSDFDDDLWFKFTTTSNSATFKLQNFTITGGSSSGLVYGLYDDSCSATSLVTSDSIPVSFGVGEKVVSGLTTGKTYYLRVATKGIGASANFKLCIMVPEPNTYAIITGVTPLAICAGAPITISGTQFTGATAVSIGSLDANNFTVTSPTSVTAVFTSGVSGNINITTPTGTAIYSNVSLTIKPSPITTLSAPCCIGSNITANANVGINQITWFYNGGPVSMQNFTYPANAITMAGGNGSGSAANQFTNPFSVATDTAGNVYVADAGNHRIQKFAPGILNGVTVAGGNGAGTAANQLSNPRSVFVDATGNLFIADAGNNRIQKWEVNAITGITVAGGNGAGTATNQLDFPHGVFVAGSGNIYVADANNHRIQKFASGSASGITVAGGNGGGSAAQQLNYATGVFVDTAGNVYANDFNNNRIQKWAPGATSGVTVAGGNGAGNAANQLNSPRSFYVDCNSIVYIADQNNHRIQRWVAGGTTGITVAGGNGAGNSATQLNSPAAVREDGKGNLYVADRTNNRIQQFSLPKTVYYTAMQGGAYKAIVSSTGCCSGTSMAVIINANTGPVICPGSSTYFVSGNSASGNTYQWQVNTGSGFVNIANNAILSGATADTLKLNVPSTAWYGYTYRSIINGTSYSPEYTLKFAVNWTGQNNTAWENAANWSCGILPDENTDVIISTGLGNYPLVNANAVCGSLRLMPGTAVTLKTGIKLDIKRKN